MKTHDLISELKRYLSDTLDVNIDPAPWGKAKLLPFLLRELYTFFDLELLNTQCLLMLDDNDKEQSPETIRKHVEMVKSKWDGEVIYLRSSITTYNRKRLIQRKLLFVVPGKQLYLPTFCIDLREHFKKHLVLPDKFNPSTQALVIYILLKRSLTNILPSTMASRLGYSAMTMSLAFDRLEKAGVGVYSLKSHKQRLLCFGGEKYMGQAFWEKVLPFLCSPVRKRVSIEPPKEKLGCRAGLTALAEYSMLAEPAKPVIALSGGEWKALKARDDINECPSSETEAMEVEVWSYDPRLFANNEVVDRLSLYLSLMGTEDERVEAALGTLLEGMKW